ncbi:MAG: biotin carboxylase N-terminal domain-containing protein, partial [Nocardioides sp.]
MDTAPLAHIRTLLIANRGEIAQRIAKTARLMGVRAVVTVVADDPAATHFDETVTVPSYLDADAIVAAALEVGADAVHPGYGFLSENAAFARAVAAAGLRFVGPTPAVIELMGRKDAARAVAVEAGVPVVPGYDLTATLPTDAWPI